VLKNECCHCGYCCKKTPCGWGEWNETKTQCVFLTGNEPGEYRCGRYHQIKDQPTADLSPAFGAGCCSSLFNGDRDSVLARRFGTVHKGGIES